MAGSINGRFTQELSGYYLYLDWAITSQGLSSGNTPYSVVTITYRIKRRSTSYNSWNKNNTSKISLSVDGSVIVDEETLNFDTRNYATDTEYALWSKSVNINHGSTGSRTVSLYLTHKSVTSAIGTQTWGGNAVLLDIPMAGALSLSANSATISSSSGASITPTIGTFISSYYYKILWKIGSTVVETTYPTAASAAKSLAAATWGAAMPSAASVTVTCELYTYSDSGRTTQIGSASTATFTLYFTIAPTMTSATAAPRGPAYNAGLTSYFYAGYSTALITGVGASGVNGSDIVSYSFYQAGALKATQTGASWTSGTLAGSGNVAFIVRATDSRGNYIEKSVSITVLAYGVPIITSYTAFRCDSSGTALASGTRINVNAAASAVANGNSIVSMSASVYSSAGLQVQTISASSGSLSGQLAGPFSVNDRFTVVITATDRLGSVGSVTIPIPTDARIINVHSGGDGLAFGEFASADLLSSAWPALFRRGITAAEHYTPANITELNNAILTALNNMDDSSLQLLSFNPSSSAVFGGGQFVALVLKLIDGYAAVVALQYSSSAGCNMYRASVYNGSVTGWSNA